MMKRTFAMLTLLLLLGAGSARAQSWESSRPERLAAATVGQWRVAAARNPAFEAGYTSSGVLMSGLFWTDCRDFTAGELGAYLKYTADPARNLISVITTFYLDHGCRPVFAEEMRDMLDEAIQRANR